MKVDGRLRLVGGKITRVSARGGVGVIVALGAWFGLCLSAFVLFVPGHPYRMQVVASAVKVPALLIGCTVVATIVSWVMSRVFGIGMKLGTMWWTSVRSVCVTAVVLACFGPLIAATAATRNYSVVVLGSYVAFGIGGVAGCIAFFRLADVGVRFRMKKVGLAGCWAAAFALTGAQLGWSLRPFVGWTGQPFEWFRSSDMTMWQQVYYELENMRGGGAAFPTSSGAPEHR